MLWIQRFDGLRIGWPYILRVDLLGVKPVDYLRVTCCERCFLGSLYNGFGRDMLATNVLQFPREDLVVDTLVEVSYIDAAEEGTSFCQFLSVYTQQRHYNKESEHPLFQ